MNFDGINGERRNSIYRVLGHARHWMSAQDICDGMRAEGSEGLLVGVGQVEKVQAVLREMERRGEVRRTRTGLRSDHWSL